MENEVLELEKYFSDEGGNKHAIIYMNSFAYMYEVQTANGKTWFMVYDRLKSPKMESFEKWPFKKDKEAIDKFYELTIKAGK
jgi:hypothetical protein